MRNNVIKKIDNDDLYDTVKYAKKYTQTTKMTHAPPHTERTP